MFNAILSATRNQNNFSPNAIGSSLATSNYTLFNAASFTCQYFNATAAQGKSMKTAASAAYGGAGLYNKSFTGNQGIQARLSSVDLGGGGFYGGGHLGICIVGFNASGYEDKGYCVDVNHGQGCNLYRMDTGSPYNLLGSNVAVPADFTNYTMGLKKVGNTISAYLNGMLVISAIDATYQTGFVEIGDCYASTVYYSDVVIQN